MTTTRNTPNVLFMFCSTMIPHLQQSHKASLHPPHNPIMLLSLHTAGIAETYCLRSRYHQMTRFTNIKVYLFYRPAEQYNLSGLALYFAL